MQLNKESFPMSPVPHDGMIRPHHSKLALLYRMMDAIWISGSLWSASVFFAQKWSHYYSTAVIFSIILFYHFAEMIDHYRSWRSTSKTAEILEVSKIWVKAMVGLLLFAYVTRTEAFYSRQVILTWLFVVPPILVIWRVLVRQFLREFRKRGYNTRKAAIVGTGNLAQNLARHILVTPWLGIQFVGYYNEGKLARDQSPIAEPIDIEGNLEDLVGHACDGTVDLIYIALPMRYEVLMRELTQKLADTTVSLYIVPDIFTSDLLHARWTDIAGIPAVSIFESPFYGLVDWIKRIEDIIIGSLILLLSAIPMVTIAIVIKLTSKGPAIFKQRRYGLDGREIVVWKFRTMTVCEDGKEVPQAVKNDSRVTPLGAFLRRTSLDELPQFINVLQGAMSIVGPRPHAVSHNEFYRELIPGYMLRHKVRPGITGWAQVNGWRGETDTLFKMQKRVEYDLYYINHWSLWLDLKIILLTSFRGFVGKNAY